MKLHLFNKEKESSKLVNKVLFPMIKEVEVFNNKVERLLELPESINEFFYPKIDDILGWDQGYVKEVKINEQNSKVIIEFSNKNLIYALHIKEREEWKMGYIGHVAKKNSRSRLINHLIQKHQKTGAQLANVQKSVLNESKIGVSFVEIEPAYMRYVVEDCLIKKMQLGWNKNNK